MTALEQELRAMLTGIVREVLRAELDEIRKSAVAAPEATAPTTEYIDDRELARWLGMSRVTLQQMRCRGEGPPYTKVARRAVRYHVPSVRAWLANQTRGRAPSRHTSGGPL